MKITQVRQTTNKTKKKVTILVQKLRKEVTIIQVGTFIFSSVFIPTKMGVIFHVNLASKYVVHRKYEQLKKQNTNVNS